MLTIRVRTQIGTYRLNDVSPSDTVLKLRERLQTEHNAKTKAGLATDTKGSNKLADSVTISEAGLSNGHMLYAEVGEGATISSSTPTGSSSESKVVISKDGSIMVTQETKNWLNDMLGDTLLTKSGNKSVQSALSGKKRIALYFSAHWCGPCRSFTPMLAEFYDSMAEGDSSALEIIFVSSDQDEGSFHEYYDEMPWTALPFSDRGRAQSLGQKFGVHGIPALIVLDQNGKVKDPDGRSTIMNARGDVARVAGRWA